MWLFVNGNKRWGCYRRNFRLKHLAFHIPPVSLITTILVYQVPSANVPPAFIWRLLGWFKETP